MTAADATLQMETGLRSEEDVVGLFSRHSTIAIVANSIAVDLDLVQRRLPPDTLFVFFTHCSKVLSSPFGRDSVIVHRMRDRVVPMNAPDVLQEARALIEPAHLKGEVGLFASLDTAMTAETKVAREPASFPVIDADALFSGFYTEQHRPSSGFALALWLVDRVPTTAVVLCGFTGVRDGSFKMSSNHDWTLEQTLLRVFYRDGRLRRFEGDTLGPVTRIAKAFPEFNPDEIALVAMQVLDERAGALDKLIAVLGRILSPVFAAERRFRCRRRGAKF